MLLSIDSGAERMGIAILEKGPKLIDVGIIYCPRMDMGFQDYKLKLEQFYADNSLDLFESYAVDEVVTEIVPAVGGGNFIGPQSELAKTATTSIHTIAYHYGVKVSQISASHVQKRITGLNPQKQKITKVKVRNGVLRLFPELNQQAKEWTKLKQWDAIDAVAIGAVHLGYCSEVL